MTNDPQRSGWPGRASDEMPSILPSGAAMTSGPILLQSPPGNIATTIRRLGARIVDADIAGEGDHLCHRLEPIEAQRKPVPIRAGRTCDAGVWKWPSALQN